MSLNWNQFETAVLRVTLLRLNPVMPMMAVVVKLVGETVWHESDRLQALGQYPRVSGVFGPGRGIASIEQPTWDWLVTVLDRRKDIHDCILQATNIRELRFDDLVSNLALNVAMCRLRYFVDVRALPSNTLDDRARYWFNVYNGSGVEERLLKYKKDALAIKWATLLENVV